MAFRLGNVDVFIFWACQGWRLITWNSDVKKKRWKTLCFWYFFPATRSVNRKPCIKSRCFVCTGDEFVSKHSVSPARDESFQLPVVRGSSPWQLGHRMWHLSSGKSAPSKIVNECIINAKVLYFIAFLSHVCQGSAFQGFIGIPVWAQNLEKTCVFL